MPRAGQIIPNWLHPHVQTYINDNTEFKEQVSSIDEGVRSLFVFTSGKGRDGEIIAKTNEVELVEEFGKPNFKLYGQPLYNAYAFLQSRLAKAWCLRVMPNDATYSNIAIVAKVKIEDAHDDVEAKMTVRFEAMQHNDLTNKSDIESVTDLLKNDTPDGDGYVTYPIFCFYSLGRGVYGDMFRVRISTDTAADKENEYRNYRLEVLELEKTLIQSEMFSGTADPDSLSGTVSLFLEDVVNDIDTGSERIGLYVCNESFDELFSKYVEKINPDAEKDVFNILFGTSKDGKPLKGITIDSSHNDAITLDNPQGIPLLGGNDGSFTYKPDTLSDREAAIDKMYIDAFDGKVDPRISSKLRVPCELILDAGYSEDVKRSLISLINKRYDAYGYIDGGILNTITDALAWGESVSTLSDRIFSKEFQHYKIRDPFTKKIIPVTTTYFLALKLPEHYKTNGNQTPFVGEDYALLTGAIKNSLAPIVDADDLETKEEFYKLRLNYYQAVAENKFIRGTQSTSQNIWSDLTEENNMIVLLEMKRKLEDMVAKLTYNLAEPEDRKRFEEDAQRMFATYPGNKIREFAVEFKMSAWEEERSILHCYLSVVFRTMVKRGIIEIDINKRV